MTKYRNMQTLRHKAPPHPRQATSYRRWWSLNWVSGSFTSSDTSQYTGSVNEGLVQLHPPAQCEEEPHVTVATTRTGGYSVTGVL